MTATTIDQARQMGRDRMPLRLTAKRRTLILSKQDSDAGMVASVETGRGQSACAVAILFADWPARPFILAEHLYCGDAYMPLADGEYAVVSAWLDGYYADGGAA